MKAKPFILIPLAASLGVSPFASGATYYWDNNGADAGFGEADGTWAAPTVDQWSTSNAGTAAPGASVTTALADTLFFGHQTTGLGAGTIAVDGTVSASEIVFAAGSGAIKLSGGTINFATVFTPRNIPGGTANTGTILVNAPNGAEIDSVITGASTVFVKSVVGNPDTVAGGPLTLSGANNFEGPTIVRGGALVLGHPLALQNSSFRTNSSLSGSATAGLRTTVPELTLGGLQGSKDLESVFSTVDSGYSDLATLTLNPGAGRIEVYAGGIAEGAEGMQLIKTGEGTQVFTGGHGYTGGTTLQGGLLLAATPPALPGHGTAGKVTFDGGTLGVIMGGSEGWSTAQVDALLANATILQGGLAIDTRGGDLTQWAAFKTDNLGNLNLQKLGANTLTLNQSNSYTGNTVLSAGTLRIQNPGTGLTQALAGLTFAGGDATLESDYNNGSGMLTTGFGTLTRATGSGANIAITGGTNGTDNLVSTLGEAGFIDPGVFFGGSAYAARNSENGFVRALSYGADPDTEVVDTVTADTHVKLTATPDFGGGLELLSLHLEGDATDYPVSSGTLTTPGILKTGGGASIVSGGAVTGGVDMELVARTDTADDELTISSQVTGTGALTKSGAGTLKLTNTGSNYSGDTFVNGGILETARTTAYGGNIFVEEGAAFHHTAGNLTLNGQIRGGGTLVKSGTGTLTLNGINGFTGGTVINGGGVTIQKIYDDAFGTGGAITFTASATLTFSSAPTQSTFIVFNRGFVLTNGAVARMSYSGNVTITGPVTGDGGLWSSNSNNTQNTLTLLSTANTFTGPITLNQTNIQPNTFVTNSLVDSPEPTLIKFASTTQPCTFRWGAGAITPLVLNNRQFELALTTGGSFIENANGDPANSLTINTDLLVTGASNKTLTLTGVNTGDNTFAGKISDGESGQVIALTKAGAGNWIVSGDNTYTGVTTCGAGILTLSGDNSGLGGNVTVNGTGQLNVTKPLSLGPGTLTFGGTAGPTIDNTSGAPLTLATNNPQSWLGEFSFVGTDDLDLGTGTVTLGGNRVVTVTANTLTVGGDITGAFGITKSGEGTLALSGDNTYTGTTTVNFGTLLVNGDASAATGPVVVNGTSTLGGAGTLGGSVTVTADANVAPGTSVGTLTILGSLNVAALAAGDGKLAFDLGPVAASDRIAVSGTVDIGEEVLGFGDFAFAALSGLAPGTYKLITSSGIIGSLDPANLTGTVGGFEAELRITDNDLELSIGGEGPSGFAVWQAANSTTGEIGEDHDGDGVANGVEFFLGGDANTTGFTALPGVTETAEGLRVTWTKAAGYTGAYGTDFVVETSATLTGTWDAEELGVTVTIDGNEVTYTFPAPLGARKFVRLKVTGPL